MSRSLVATKGSSSLSEEEAGRLFEKLFLHYRIDVISEREMLEFFEKLGIKIKDRKELLLLIYKAERNLKWTQAGVGLGWTPTVCAKSYQDLEEFLEKHGVKPK